MFFRSKKSKEEGRAAAPGNPAVPGPQPPPLPESNSRTADLNAPIAAPTATSSTQVPNSVAPAAATEDQTRQGAAYSARLRASFGEIVSLLMRTPAYKSMALGSLDNVVVPAVVSGQFLIAQAQSKSNGLTAPVAAVLWASVSEEVDRRLSSELDRPVQLQSNEWRSGDVPWLILTVGDQRMVNELIAQLQKTSCKGRTIKTRTKSPDGRVTVREIQVRPADS